MTFIPLWIALLIAALDWLAVANNWQKSATSQNRALFWFDCLDGDKCRI
jgi:hypothetical protein